VTTAGQEGRRIPVPVVNEDGTDETIARIIAAVAPDLDRAGYDRARRECADELRAELRRSPSTPRVAAERAIKRWSSSGRAPAGEEQR
jgi:hypothetical protein